MGGKLKNSVGVQGVQHLGLVGRACQSSVVAGKFKSFHALAHVGSIHTKGTCQLIDAPKPTLLIATVAFQSNSVVVGGVRKGWLKSVFDWRVVVHQHAFREQHVVQWSPSVVHILG